MSSDLNQDGGLWPTPAQEQLLKAALGEDSSALEHFYAWRSMINLADDFDRGSFRLLPLLYANMLRFGLNDSLMGRLKGTYRRAWCEAQPRFEQASSVLALLQENGIETLLIKGIPLAISYYGNPTLRPMADLDVVVPHAKAAQAIALMQAAGWIRGPKASDEDLVFHHAMQFFWPTGGELDLHWHVLTECRSPEADEHFWRNAEPLMVKGVSTRQLGHTDMFLHSVIHGVRWNAEPPIRWIADAAMVLRRADRQIEWSEILAFTQREKLNHRLRLGLNYLAERIALPIPSHVLEALANRPVTLIERLENTIVLRDSEDLYRSPVAKNWVIFVRYCRFHQAKNPWQFLNGLSHYFRVRWAIAGRGQMPGVILRGLARRLFRRSRPEQWTL